MTLRLSELAFAVATSVLLATAEGHGLTPEQVLIVANDRSPISGQIAAYYQQARAIPPNHLVRLKTAPDEEIERDTFRREIAQPIAAHLLQHHLPDQVLVIALT